jgi:hypothetical protein
MTAFEDRLWSYLVREHEELLVEDDRWPPPCRQRRAMPGSLNELQRVAATGPHRLRAAPA